jgi:hypothetical protein
MIWQGDVTVLGNCDGKLWLWIAPLLRVLSQNIMIALVFEYQNYLLTFVFAY